MENGHRPLGNLEELRAFPTVKLYGPRPSGTSWERPLRVESSDDDDAGDDHDDENDGCVAATTDDDQPEDSGMFS